MAKTKIPTKHYTISTQLFTSLSEAKKKIAEFYEQNPNRFRKETKLMEVTEVYDVDVQEIVEVTVKKADPDKQDDCCGECDERPGHPNCRIDIVPKKKGVKKHD